MAERDRDHWARVAGEWTAWARAPGHDAFWAYVPALRACLGPGPGEALDLGCGEGRVAREMTDLGWRVTACDAVPAMVAAARGAGSAAAYAVAEARALPFPAASFDLVVCYNVLMDVEDVPGACREIARVLRPGGSAMIGIVHPFSDRGRFEGEGEEAPFVLQGSYFGRTRFEGREERDGLVMRWAGWSQPLEAYAAALEGAGLGIAGLREPRPDPAAARLAGWRRVPLFLWMTIRRWG